MKTFEIFKNKTPRQLLVLVAFSLSSCQTFQRQPASQENEMPEQFSKLYDVQLELLDQQEKLRREQRE